MGRIGVRQVQEVLVEGNGAVRSASSQTAPSSVLPNFLPSERRISGLVRPKRPGGRCGAAGRACRDVPQLVAAADLEPAAVEVVELLEVVGLEHLVGELGEAHPPPPSPMRAETDSLAIIVETLKCFRRRAGARPH